MNLGELAPMPKSVVLVSNRDTGVYVDYSSPSWEEAVGWAKSRTMGSGNPSIVIEFLGEEQHGKIKAFYRSKEMNVVEWRFWD